MNTKLTFKQIITAAAVASGVALVVNAILFYIFHAAGVITDDIMIQPGQAMTIVPILISSVMPTMVGACVFFLFEKFGKSGFKTFSIVSLILLVVSFINPFVGIPNVTVAYAVVLNIMHVVVAGSLLYFIKRAKQ
ncbi:MAG: hypothetical protein CFE21_15010 [Bacteroidetes bacterium B1(2017)]|nr:MAG: hypothetical protein CFE21_15010 [Bacteroidetes bacterium B1(2017)]